MSEHERLTIATVAFFQDLCADQKHRFRRQWDDVRRCSCGAVHPDDRGEPPR